MALRRIDGGKPEDASLPDRRDAEPLARPPSLEAAAPLERKPFIVPMRDASQRGIAGITKRGTLAEELRPNGRVEAVGADQSGMQIG